MGSPGGEPKGDSLRPPPRSTLLSKTAEEYRDNAAALTRLQSGLKGLAQTAKTLAQQDAHAIVSRFGHPPPRGLGGKHGDGGSREPQASREAGASALAGSRSGFTGPPRPTVTEPWLDDPSPDYDTEPVMAFASRSCLPSCTLAASPP